MPFGNKPTIHTCTLPEYTDHQPPYICNAFEFALATNAPLQRVKIQWYSVRLLAVVNQASIAATNNRYIVFESNLWHQCCDESSPPIRCWKNSNLTSSHSTASSASLKYSQFTLNLRNSFDKSVWSLILYRRFWDAQKLIYHSWAAWNCSAFLLHPISNNAFAVAALMHSSPSFR